MGTIEVRVGAFVKEHLPNIIEYLGKKPDHSKELRSIKYTKETFFLTSNQYPFMSNKKNVFKDSNNRYRCWNNSYKSKTSEKYYFCNQWASKKFGEKRGNAFKKYLEGKEILLEKYNDKEIKFITGSTKGRSPDLSKNTSKPSKEVEVHTLPLNQILYGPPGTGKTYSTVDTALGILGATEDQKQNIKSIGKLKKAFKSQVEFVTFHQSFSYEDFVEGLKVKIYDKKLSYEIEGGIFKEICREAKAKSDKTHVLIIDEINRGNISRIFGELITLIEPSKRAGESEVISVKLPYSKEDFSVPNNLYIIGTMNTADRSLTMIDTALRRRFDFIEMAPDVGLVKGDFDGIKVGKILEFINKRIEILYDREHLIGHSFLMGIDDLRGLRNVFKNKILPLLEEYFYDDFENIRKVLNDKEEKFYEETKVDGSLFFGNENIQKDSYKKVNIDELTAEYFQQIYKNKDE